MEHFFDLPVTYIVVDKFELEVERDDEMQFRVLSYDTAAKIDPVLIAAIVSSLEKLNQ